MFLINEIIDFYANFYANSLLHDVLVTWKAIFSHWNAVFLSFKRIHTNKVI